ncbi:prolyl oligopeptidase family serine peptidase [Hyphomicrobium sp. CS1GBMeth3]|uniref:alpha/beta hydrolase family protein n=1 Tax=Hyphomicrobium sp. CS1GBMeth3 TaxID=1892845 RepID=UPI000ABD321D|nr:prolyl oligopeptidase family serine peptidase [Hyphomicrobium sp. CS1GBMeth3]
MLCAALMPVLAFLIQPHTASAEDARAFGPFGPEGPRLREQFWILPSADPDYPLRATVFRPDDEPRADGVAVRHPLVVINHGTSDATRLAVAMPVYYWLSRWFVERGYVVVLPQRRGHGATGGPMAESIGSCANPDHYLSGLAAADDIGSTVDYMSEQPFVVPGEAIVVGISSGGWASLALAARNPESVRAVINIAGGRGGRPFGQNVDSVCGEDRLIAAARDYGRTARAPTLWLYAENDSYFRPELASAMAAAWRDGGGNAALHVFPPYGEDGHGLADDRAGWDVWGTAIEAFLSEPRPEAPVAALEPVPEAATAGVTPVEATVPLATVASDGETRAP